METYARGASTAAAATATQPKRARMMMPRRTTSPRIGDLVSVATVARAERHATRATTTRPRRPKVTHHHPQAHDVIFLVAPACATLDP